MSRQRIPNGSTPMLAEPWHLKGYQESRLREFLELVQVNKGSVVRH